MELNTHIQIIACFKNIKSHKVDRLSHGQLPGYDIVLQLIKMLPFGELDKEYIGSLCIIFLVFPGGASDKGSNNCQCRRYKRCGFHPWVRKIPWRRAWQRTPVFLPGVSHGQKSLAGYHPWDRTESDTTEAT